jgi:DNA-binding beta-propeller fold protein YncE
MPKTRRSKYTFLPVIAAIAVLILASCGGGSSTSSSGSGSGSGSGTGTTSSSGVTKLSLAVSHLVYDTTRNVLYASCSSADTTYPNKIVVINPTTQAVVSSFSAGTNPDQMALSADGTYLYVGNDGNNTLVRYNLSTNKIEQTISLPSFDSLNPGLAEGIAISPTDSKTVAVNLGSTNLSANWGIAVYDDNVLRGRVNEVFGYGNRVFFSSDGSQLYSVAVGGSPQEVDTFDVSDGGFSLVDEARYVLLGMTSWNDGWLEGAMGIIDSNGILYGTTGFAYNPATRLKEAYYPVNGAFAADADSSANLLYFLDPATDGSTTLIREFSTTNQLNVSNLSLGMNCTLDCYDLYKLGTNSFVFVNKAFSATSSSVIFVQKSPTSVTADNRSLAKLPFNHIVYDAKRGKIYGTLPDTVAGTGNSVAVINPQSYTIENYLSIGNAPNALAISSDDSYLYVGLDGSGAVARVNLSTMSVDQTMPLQNAKMSGTGTQYNTYEGTLWPGTISVSPSDPTTIAVATQMDCYCAPSEGGDVTFTNGVENGTNLQGESADASDLITFGASTSELYGIEYGNEGIFQQLDNAAAGVTRTKNMNGLTLSTPIAITYDNGVVFTADGSRIDPLTATAAGRYTVSDGRSIVVDNTASKVYLLADDTRLGSSAIFAFDKDSMVLKEEMPLSLAEGTGRDLIPCGTNCFAYLSLPGLQVVNYAPTTPATPTAATLLVNHMRYDPVSKRIYATVPGNIPVYGNSVAIIDPSSQAIESSIYVGSEPMPLAIAADGSTLYVGLDGTGEVKKVDLATQAVSTVATMPVDPNNGPYFAAQLAVAPTTPTRIAVTRREQYTFEAPMYGDVYDDSVMTISDIAHASGVVFGDDTHLYTSGDTYDFGVLYRIALDTGSAVTTGSTAYAIIMTVSSSWLAPSLTYNSGVIYGPEGSEIDPSNGLLLNRLTGNSTATGFAMDPANAYQYYLSDTSSTSAAIRTYDRATQLSLGSTTVPTTGGSSHDLVAYDGGVAFATTGGQILFATPALTAPVTPSLSTVPVNHIAYDTQRGLLYATIPSSGGSYGNSVLVIDPSTESVVTALPMGGEPGRLAVSNDQSYLYVTMSAASLVKRINLTTRQVDQTIPLGVTWENIPALGQDVAVAPDSNTTIAVLASAEMEAFQSGAQLTTLSGGNAWQFIFANNIAFGPTSATLYAATSDGFFGKYSVTSSGISLVSRVSGLFNSAENCMAYAATEDRIFLCDGTVINPETVAVDGALTGYTGIAIRVDESAGRVFLLTGQQLAAMDSKSYSLLGHQVLSTANGVPTDFVRWGSTGFIFSSASGITFLPTSTLVN